MCLYPTTRPYAKQHQQAADTCDLQCLHLPQPPHANSMKPPPLRTPTRWHTGCACSKRRSGRLKGTVEHPRTPCTTNIGATACASSHELPCSHPSPRPIATSYPASPTHCGIQAAPINRGRQTDSQVPYNTLVRHAAPTTLLRLVHLPAPLPSPLPKRYGPTLHPQTMVYSIWQCTRAIGLPNMYRKAALHACQHEHCSSAACNC